MCTTPRVLRWTLILLAYFSHSNVSIALDFNPASVKGIAQAYGYVLGQEYALSRIANEFPESAGEVELARAQFGSTFPGIKSTLEKQLKQDMGEKLFQQTKKNLQTKLKGILGRQQITRQTATDFLVKVKNRAKGEIESPQ